VRASHKPWRALGPRWYQPHISISKRSHEPTPEVFQEEYDHEMIRRFATCSLGTVHGAM